MLSTDDKAHTYIGIPVSRSPYVLEDGAILIFPGETLAFKFNIDNGTLGKPEFIMAFAPQMPARVDINGKLSDNPLDANLPPLPTKDGNVDMSALPANSIILSYGEASEHKTGMMLSSDSTLTRAIKFEDTMYVVHPGKSGYTEFHTSTCPVRAGRGVFETWPHPIGPMILTNLRFVPDKETVCK
ncbi:hypothetical protein AEAC466_11705 [Asticcacaulis sp. AC466]|nr:hypothetical protein AEAC466_11705 [Asticcacaulis sp. AC466]